MTPEDRIQELEAKLADALSTLQEIGRSTYLAWVAANDCAVRVAYNPPNYAPERPQEARQPLKHFGEDA